MPVMDVTLGPQRYHNKRDPSVSVYTKEGHLLLESSTPLADVSRLFLAQSVPEETQLRIAYPDGRVSVTPGSIKEIASWSYVGGNRQALKRIPYKPFDASVFKAA